MVHREIRTEAASAAGAAFLETIFADGAYGGAKLRRAIADAAWRIELVKRSAQAKGFEVIPRRWVRAIAITNNSSHYPASWHAKVSCHRSLAGQNKRRS